MPSQPHGGRTTDRFGALAQTRRGLGAPGTDYLHAIEEQLSAPEIAVQMELCSQTVRFWIKRFNARGLQGLVGDVRSGRPPTCSAEEKRGGSSLL